MIFLDLELITIICLIIVLIYNYMTTECYYMFKQNRNYYSNYNNNFVGSQSGFVNTYDTPINAKQQKIELSGFANESNNVSNNASTNLIQNPINNNTNKSVQDSTKLPDINILNDRYNDFITPYTDEQLNNVITESPSNTFSSEYSQSLVDDLQKNIIFDIDTKAYTKSKATQKLAKDSATIASRFGRNSLLDSYKNELDEYEKERTPWWAETDDAIITDANIYTYR